MSGEKRRVYACGEIGEWQRFADQCAEIVGNVNDYASKSGRRFIYPGLDLAELREKSLKRYGAPDGSIQQKMGFAADVNVAMARVNLAAHKRKDPEPMARAMGELVIALDRLAQSLDICLSSAVRSEFNQRCEDCRLYAGAKA